MVEKAEGKRPLGRPRHRLEGIIKMDLQGMEWGGLDWIYLIQDRDKWWPSVNAVMNFWVLLNVENFFTS
jgi:hypothetical protein